MNGKIKIESYNGDCLEVMQQLPSKSIDMILCDLPYGTTACKWDSVIPFEPLWEQYERLIKDNSVIVLTSSQPFTSALIMSNPKAFKYEWIWDKKMCSGFMAAKYRPLLAHENILVFSYGTHGYYPQFIERTEIELKRFSHKSKDIQSKTDHAKHLQLSNRGRAEAKLKNPSSLIRINGLVNSSSEKKQASHPTQKPVELMEYLIKTYTKEGYTILDNCMGSGTTGVACYNTNRNFIGIEKDEKYYDLAMTRINKIINESLF